MNDQEELRSADVPQGTCEYVPADDEHCKLLLAWIEREIDRGHNSADEAMQQTFGNDNPFGLVYQVQQRRSGMDHFDPDSAFRIILKGPPLDAATEKITIHAVTPQGTVVLENVPVSFLKDRPPTVGETLKKNLFVLVQRLWNLLP